MDTRPVGFFDSGFGGLSVLLEAKRVLPTENYIYFGDNANAPYGDKTEEEIAHLAFSCADFLVSRGVKAIVLACNTATGISINDIRTRLSIPVISVEPAIKPACEYKHGGKVLMLATRATTALERYHSLKARIPGSEDVIDVPCPGLADRIEQGKFNIGDFDDLLYSYLSPYFGMTVDAVVLGCTHYIFIKDAVYEFVRKHFSGDCKLFDGNNGTAKQLKRVLCKNNLTSTSGKGSVEFHTSGDINTVLPIYNTLMSR